MSRRNKKRNKKRLTAQRKAVAKRTPSAESSMTEPAHPLSSFSSPALLTPPPISGPISGPLTGAQEALNRLKTLLGQNGEQLAAMSHDHDDGVRCHSCQGLEEIELRFSDEYASSLYIRFMRANGVKTFRSKGQRKTTVCVAVKPERWLELEIAWRRCSDALRQGFEEHYKKLCAHIDTSFSPP
jgi:hypothetical protein